ncbi:two-component regulator propeller domain-containing protein [Bacteroides sp.]
MRKLKLYLSLFGILCVFLYVSELCAQNDIRSHYFKSLDIQNGLPQNTVNAILQDCQGFMWMATKDGLSRYDGLNFRIFKKENSGLGNNFITSLFEDINHNIWVGTDAGVYIYYPCTESFEHFHQVSDKGTVIERAVTSIGSDDKGDIWIASDFQGLFYYNLKRKELTNYLCREDGKAEHANVTQFWFDTDGTCWFALYGDNLYTSKDRFKTLVPFSTANGKQPYEDDIVNRIVPGASDYLYLGSAKGGLKEINRKTNEVRDILLYDEHGEPIYVRGIAFYSDEELWVGAESGLFIYNMNNGNTVHLTSVIGDDYSLSDNAIYALYKDQEEGMWIGSYFGGVNYCPKQYTYFEKFYAKGDADGFGRRVREFCEGTDGTIWIGTEDKGLFNLNPATGRLTPFTHPLIYHNVHGLCLDGNYLWVGTFSGGLNRIDLRNKSVKGYRKSNADNTLGSNDIFAICRTTTGALWIGTTFGLYYYNKDTDDFTHEPELGGKFVYDIYEGSDGKMWLATYADGVYCYDAIKKQWNHYVYEENNPNSLPYDKVLSIFEDSRKRIWFTTQGRGFCRFIPERSAFVRYDSSDGFPSNVIHQIVEDDDHLLWLTTNKGLVRFNPDTNEKKVYTTANGLLSDQFNYRSSYKDKSGKIYLGCINGFVSFHPSTFMDNMFVPPVVITDFLLFNKAVKVNQKDSPLKESISFSDEIELKADQNSFTFRIAALSYQSPRMNKLIYKLEGFDKEWYTVQNPVINYSNLPYGTYTFMVKGSNSDGWWNDKPTLLKIRISPPFYLSVWAYIIYILLFIGLVVSIILYYRFRNIRKQKRVMEKFEQEKARELYTAKIDFFTNVAHEIRTPLTLIKSPLENVLREKELGEDVREDLLIMDQNANRLLDLTNQLLDFRKTESEGFKLSFVEWNISELVREIYTRFTPLARQKKLTFSMELPETDILASVDKEGFTKIISNLFTNAIKYSETYIRVQVVLEENNFLCVRVSNDGKIVPLEMRDNIFKPFVQYKDGNKVAVTGTGIGLALARSLAELHHGTLCMNDEMDSNCFILSLPISHQETIALAAKTEGAEVNTLNESEESKEDKIADTSKNKLTLLIVEDDSDMRTFISKQLSPYYQILTACNGQEALDVLDGNYVNLIISDVMMPLIDGLELCDRLKSDLTYSHVPIILLTAKTNLQAKIAGLQSGADAYIEKPFSVEYLKVCISSLLKNRDKLRIAFAHSPFVSTGSVAMTKADETFLKTLNEIVLSNMQDSEFNLDDMAGLLNMSRSSLNRKIKGILDMTPNDYIRLERLKKAAQLLREGECKVNEVCYMVGFNTPSYFTKCFQKQFGALPKDFAKQS